MRGAINLGPSGAGIPPTLKTGIADGAQAGQRAEETGALHDHPSRQLETESTPTAGGYTDAVNGLEAAIAQIDAGDELYPLLLRTRAVLLRRLGRAPLYGLARL
jgi:hypothetical protein